ncbi:hypothetical protein D3C73_1359090 [compost metagenome]
MLQFNGSVRWGWMYGLGQFQYGVRLVLSEEEEERLNSELETWTMSSEQGH